MKVIEIAFVLEKKCRHRLKTILPTLGLQDKKIVLRPRATIFKESFGIAALVNVGRHVQVTASGLIITDDFAAFKTPKLTSQSLPRYQAHFIVIAHRPDISVESIQEQLLTNPTEYNSLAYDFYLSGKIGAKVVNRGRNPEWIFDYASMYAAADLTGGDLTVEQAFADTPMYTLPSMSGFTTRVCSGGELREITINPFTDIGIDPAISLTSSPTHILTDSEGLHVYTAPSSSAGMTTL